MISNFKNQEINNQFQNLRLMKKGSNLIISNHTIFRFYDIQTLDEEDCYENYQNNESLNNN